MEDSCVLCHAIGTHGKSVLDSEVLVLKLLVLFWLHEYGDSWSAIHILMPANLGELARYDTLIEYCNHL